MNDSVSILDMLRVVHYVRSQKYYKNTCYGLMATFDLFEIDIREIP